MCVLKIINVGSIVNDMINLALFYAITGILVDFFVHTPLLSFLSCCAVWNQMQLCMKVASKVLFLFAGKHLCSLLLVSV